MTKLGDTPKATADAMRALSERVRYLETLPVQGTLPGARVYNNANIAIPSGAWTALTFNSERFDTDGIHETVGSTGRLTCRTAGKYIIGGGAQFADSAAGTRRVFGILLNSGSFIAIGSSPFAATYGGSVAIATLWSMAVGDFVEFLVTHDVGAPLNITYSPTFSPEFWMQRVS